MALAGLLSRPEVGAASVYLDETFSSDGRTDWRWPFTLATLPGDALAEPLAALQSQFPPSWPFRFATAGRDDPRIEVLVIGAGAGEALSRLLASGLRLRCCLVIVAGLGTDSPSTADRCCAPCGRDHGRGRARPGFRAARRSNLPSA